MGTTSTSKFAGYWVLQVTVYEVWLYLSDNYHETVRFIILYTTMVQFFLFQLFSLFPSQYSLFPFEW